MKHIQNMNARELRVNPIADTPIASYGIDWWYCTIYIVNVFDFVAHAPLKKSIQYPI